MINTYLEKTMPLAGITFNGKHSYLDFGLTIKEKSFPTPKKRTIKGTVPYMNGEYDFSAIAGKPTYEPRKIKIVFNIHGKNQTEIWDRKRDITDWLTSEAGGDMTFDTFKDTVFRNVSATVGDLDFYRRDTAALTVNFTADPYAKHGTYDYYVGHMTGDGYQYLYSSEGVLAKYVDVSEANNLIETYTEPITTGEPALRLCWNVNISTEILLVLKIRGSVNKNWFLYTTYISGETKELVPDLVVTDGEYQIAVKRFKRTDYRPFPMVLYFAYDPSQQGAPVPQWLRAYNITELEYPFESEDILKPLNAQSQFAIITNLSGELLPEDNLYKAGTEGTLYFVEDREVL